MHTPQTTSPAPCMHSGGKKEFIFRPVLVLVVVTFFHVKREFFFFFFETFMHV